MSRHQNDSALVFGQFGEMPLFPARLIWIPQPLRSLRNVAVLSSRLGYQLQEYQQLFAALRTRVAHLSDQERLISASGTTLDRYVRRAAYWFNRAIVCINYMPNQVSPAWILNTLKPQSDAHRIENIYISRFTCELDPATHPVPSTARTNDRDHEQDQQKIHAELNSETHDQGESWPIDQSVANMADEVAVVHLKSKGNLHRVVKTRLAKRIGLTCVLDSVRADLVRELLEHGALRWHLVNEESKMCRGTQPSLIASHPNSQPADPSIHPMRHPTRVRPRDLHTEDEPLQTLGGTTSHYVTPQFVFTDYLIHFTRRQKRQWIDETENQALDRVLFGLCRPTSERTIDNYSAMATLQKIVAQRRILASTWAIRGKYPCVCWTERSLPELIKSRVYRHHRSRWDAEPYGIAVRKEALIRLQAQPVIYGDDETWSSLSDEQRPYFQKRNSRNRKIDWAEEKEWRIQGPFDLRYIASDEAFLFVMTMEEAEILRPTSLWPVFAVDSLQTEG
ncbi:MAG TPA: hypothetical protein PKD64_13540 [Pirellulaceae bacterium]|nr:hypothetical protein [Pirellulaceae bacterium]HMO93208.1 hypothetical protein [Pirellulaceae bacterium]HMP70039.1 hypothetical protein [Pirellulaceae bacterium]